MQKADTIGVFQIESRAQMATLPRMKPKCFYDVVIEVAIIRPGPIQGDMVHPYLNRRAGREPVTYFDPRLEPILERTLGVPLFQEQMLKIAMIMADFSGAEAEELRRALSFHRSVERMEKVSVKLRAGMEKNGVAPEVMVKIIQAISSFALYGFPESHAISFAILAYGSAYLKVHRAAEFYASLLNNQPMGFYAPATIVKDARRHGIRMRPVCVAESEWRCAVESDESVRLGFCVVNGLRQEHAEELVRQRARARLSVDGGFQATRWPNERGTAHPGGTRRVELFGRSIGGQRCGKWKRRCTTICWGAHAPRVLRPAPRRMESWPTPAASKDVCGGRRKRHARRRTRRAGVRSREDSPLAPMTLPERVQADYERMNLTTGPHPMKLLREQLPERLAGDRSGGGASRRDGPDRRERDLPSATRDGEGICLHQPGG